MEKAILFEPELLAEVEIKSPDLYEYYCNSPLSLYEFVDYGTPGFPMYIQKEVLDLFEPYKKYKSLNIHGIILALQAGYICGHYDLVSKYPGNIIDPITCAVIMRTIMNICFKYPYYTIESLLDTDNMDCRKGIPYSKLTYKEAQYFVAWNTIFDRHEDWNSFFVKIKAM
ncbi:MAG TPA: hypothetical protein VK205_18170, partial [Prolixibacteraceae bacterium]|nr:hypothetical protein [Prolixibacteraceae bacterium]